MKRRLVSIVVFSSALVGCFAQQTTKTVADKAQQVSYVTVCDTSKIYLYSPELEEDTLQGKGVIELSLKKVCKDIKIMDGQILLLSVVSKKQRDKKVIDYRYLESENLTNDEKKKMNFYEKEIYETFKKRGICCEDEDMRLDGKGFYFSFRFIVLPKQ